jgi:hypothetical protein
MMDFKMIVGLVAAAVGFLGAMATVLVVLLGHPHASNVAPFPTPRHTPALSTRIHTHIGTSSCHRHC